jgi:hypothetical protein
LSSYNKFSKMWAILVKFSRFLIFLKIINKIV